MNIMFVIRTPMRLTFIIIDYGYKLQMYLYLLNKNIHYPTMLITQGQTSATTNGV